VNNVDKDEDVESDEVEEEEEEKEVNTCYLKSLSIHF